MPNVVTVSYDYYLGCYLSGLFAAKVSKTGKIGYIGGVSLPPLNADLNAMKTAAAAVGPNITVTGRSRARSRTPPRATKSPPRCTRTASTTSRPTRRRPTPASSRPPTRARAGWSRRISPAQYALGPKTVAALVALDFGQSLYNEVSKAIGPDFKGGHLATGLGTGVIDFVLSPVWVEQGPADLVAKAKEVWPEIEKARADIIAGTLKVPFNTEL